MTLKKQASESVGELIISGVSGLEISGDLSDWISKIRLGGIILFSHNYESPLQMARFIDQLQKSSSQYPLWISVDQEGGRVQRFKKGFTLIPDAASLGRFNSVELVYKVSRIIAEELKTVGVNLNFCPVADILTHSQNTVIGNRSYGENAEIVSKMISAVIRGHLDVGVQPCMKHFPGHGNTSIDSHFALPHINIPLSVLEAREFKPFLKGIQKKCSMIMIAHILNFSLDKEFPATLSKFFIQELLINKFQFKGLIFTDDLDMKAIVDNYGVTEAPLLALQAGCDFLIYRTQQTAQLAYESCVHAIEKGILNPERILISVEKSRAMKKKWLFNKELVVFSKVESSLRTQENLNIIEKIKIVICN